MINCAICSENFPSLRSLHAHFKKHGIFQHEYYSKYYPRFSLFYKKPIPYKNYEDYFNKKFICYQELLDWEKSADSSEIKNISFELLKNRIEEKNLSRAPGVNELKIRCLPSIDTFKKHFGSYNAVCRLLNVKPLYYNPLPKDFFLVKINEEILIDTREQDPLPFPIRSVGKIYVGDYLFKSLKYDGTFIDRKSEGDFLGTLSSGKERFEREIQKAKELDGYLFVVIESDIDSIYENQHKFCRKTNLEYIFHNMNELTHKYADYVQFVFTGGRNNSLDIIPRLLFFGKELKNVDIQYFLNHELGRR